MFIEKLRDTLFFLYLKYLVKSRKARELIYKYGCPQCGNKSKAKTVELHKKCDEKFESNPKKYKRIIEKNLNKWVNPSERCAICGKKLTAELSKYSYYCSKCGFLKTWR